MRELKEVAESMEVRAYKAVKPDGTRWQARIQDFEKGGEFLL